MPFKKNQECTEQNDAVKIEATLRWVMSLIFCIIIIGQFIKIWLCLNSSGEINGLVCLKMDENAVDFTGDSEVICDNNVM